MNSKRFLILFVLISMILFGVWLPANASPGSQQTIPTPTAGVDGRIIYVVQPGDNCFRVANINLITVDQLRQLNSRLDENCTLVVGQELLIGIISPATETPETAPTPGEPTPTPTPLSGTTEVCVLVFDDINGNAMHEATEPAVAGGAVSLTELNGKYSGSQDTVIPADPAAYQGICFTNIPEGNYNITVAIPDNFNPTTELTYSLVVNAGDIALVPFGVQSRDVVMDPSAAEESSGGGGSSTFLGIFGALLLLSGGALGYYAWRSSKPESKLGSGLPRR